MYRLTDLAKHHFFGFHDLLISNKKGNKLLALQVDAIDHPPRKNQPANIGFVEIPKSRSFDIDCYDDIKIVETIINSKEYEDE